MSKEEPEITYVCFFFLRNSWFLRNLQNISFKTSELCSNLTLKCQPYKMIKHTQIIRRQQPTDCLSVFDHLVRLALKGLKDFNLCHTYFISFYTPENNRKLEVFWCFQGIQKETSDMKGFNESSESSET